MLFRSPGLSLSLSLPLSWSLPLSTAEVQAHSSSQQSRTEMDQLREQLLDAFRQQMEIRKSLMELENSNMEIQMDMSRHLHTVTESVSQDKVVINPAHCWLWAQIFFEASVCRGRTESGRKKCVDCPVCKLPPLPHRTSWRRH